MNSSSHKESRLERPGVMDQRHIRLGLVALVASVFAVAFSLLLLQAQKAAVVFFVLGSVSLFILLDPFVGLVCYLVFVYVRPVEIFPTLVGAPLYLVTISGAFASMMIRLAFNRRSFDFIRAPQDYLLIWLVLAIILSHLSHGDIGNAVRSLWSFLPAVALYFLITNLVEDEKRLRVFIYALVCSTLFLAVQGLVQHYFGWGISALSPQAVEKVQGALRNTLRAGRIVASGSALDPNIYGLILLVSLPFLYFGLTSATKRIAKFVIVVAILLIAWVIYLTNSRGAVVSVAALLGAGFVKRWGLIVGMLLGGMVTVAAFVFGPTRMQEVSVTHEGRLALWNTAFGLFQSNPIFGIGKDALSEKLHLMVAHNSFIQCAAELGVFGLIPWVLLVYLSMKNAWYVSRQAVGNEFGRLGVYAAAVFWGCAAFVLPAMFLSRTFFYLLFVLVALSVAVTQAFVGISGRRYILFEKMDFVCAVIIALGGLVAFRVYLLMTQS